MWKCGAEVTRAIADHIFMLSPLDNVGEGIIFSRCPSAAFVRTDVVTTISHERLDQSR